MCPPASHSTLALFSGSEEKSAIESLPDDETSSAFSAVHLDLTGEGPERGGLYKESTLLL